MQRRRFIKILASSVAGVNLARIATATQALQPVSWHGYTLGAEGSFTLYTENKDKAQKVLQHCFAEIRRLEKIFSLYDPQSELSRLNRDGQLIQPSAEWQSLLSSVSHAHRLTHGLFDPTVQPLWQTYAEYFKQRPNSTTGPTQSDIDSSLAQTGWKHVSYSAGHIQFERKGMQLTLNGIAQGFITDHISSILKNAGYQHVLIELGETRAIGAHPEERPWSIGIKDAEQPEHLHEIAELDDQALATSGSYGSPFSSDGNYHHLIHPQTGHPSTHWKSVSVIAPTATQADALSTGLSFASATDIEMLEQVHSELRVMTQA